MGVETFVLFSESFGAPMGVETFMLLSESFGAPMGVENFVLLSESFGEAIMGSTSSGGLHSMGSSRAYHLPSLIYRHPSWIPSQRCKGLFTCPPDYLRKLALLMVGSF
ncbi:hypothetical protein LWI29_035783 [Acer saccharum]|uniref:Uncharacterized protein n=1 Tax=Acer saccharum TaxID=4024 RepID=A0AA39RP15_ACESA|nr:hypothetical protein LWI29_035783 [Acer saccharum]